LSIIKHAKLAVLTVLLLIQFALGQQPATFHRVGDVFTGPVKSVRSERTVFVRKGEQLVETAATLKQIATYSTDGLSRETIAYDRNGSPREKTVETYHSDGNRDTVNVFNSEGNLVSSTSHEYQGGRLVAETRYKSDSSTTKVKKFIQWSEPAGTIVSHSKISENGNQIETAVNTRDETTKTSKWTYTLADGSRTENIFSLDPTQDHVTETLSYAHDGSLTSRRIARSDRAVTRLEATEFDGKGNVLKKTMETREYDSRRNLIKIVNYRWNAEMQQFEPAAATYHRINYFQ
jgi:hypothetical protein